jgi:serine/threonine protein phosphatase PrpC
MAINVEMPLHKARELMAPYRNAMPINNPLPEIDTEPPEAPHVMVDAVTIGGATGSRQNPLLRHVLVKDLNKISTRLKFALPKGGVFSNKAPMGLYALFDGQSCASEPGPMAAEFCARNFHSKLLRRLSEVPADPDEAAIQAALTGTFEDLDADLLTQPEILDGCGAAVALLIGSNIFTAVTGQCSAVLGVVEGSNTPLKPLWLGGRQGVVEGDLMRIRYGGGMVHGERGQMRIKHPAAMIESEVSRALGDRLWKDVQAGLKAPVVACTPEVFTTALKGPGEHPFLVLAASTVSAAMTNQEIVDVAGEFPKQPRASCGEITAKAASARAGAVQCTAVQVSMLPPRGGAGDNRKRAPGTAGPEPPPSQAAKKARTANAPGGGTLSVRLRHILLRISDGTPGVKRPGKPRQEAEAVLRKALIDLKADLKSAKKTPKDAVELVAATTKKFVELAKSLSECETARKGGAMCGDLGWLTPEELASHGGTLKEVVDVLLPGQFSDIAATDSGLHLLQRVA